MCEGSDTSDNAARPGSNLDFFKESLIAGTNRSRGSGIREQFALVEFSSAVKTVSTLGAWYTVTVRVRGFTIQTALVPAPSQSATFSSTSSTVSPGRDDLDRQVGSTWPEGLREAGLREPLTANEGDVGARTVSGSVAILKPVSAPTTTPS